MDFKYKIADVAKEFGMPAKKVVETVSGVTGEAYKTAGTFEEKELNVLLETLTRENAFLYPAARLPRIETTGGWFPSCIIFNRSNGGKFL